VPAFRAFRIREHDGGVQAGFEQLELEDLTPGEVVIRTRYSSVNYKDALAATGSGRVLRRFPLVGGIDVAGIVESSTDRRVSAGAAVLVTGCGLGEDHDGGYAERVRVPADWVVPLPDGLTLHEAMAIGTAGFTAALALERMEQNGLVPGDGPLLVSGASGGVGSLAVDLFSARGYEVVALTGKVQAEEYLRGLGANTVLDRQQLEMGTRPLEKAQWGGALDNVGGETLAWLTRSVKPWGSIASIGLAGGSELHTTVMPFILRGISILGITSANCPMPRRRRLWQRLATDLRPRHLDAIVEATIAFDALPAAFEHLLSGTQLGRTVVRIGDGA
jgi:NADPH2:quinone reductase